MMSTWIFKGEICFLFQVGSVLPWGQEQSAGSLLRVQGLYAGKQTAAQQWSTTVSQRSRSWNSKYQKTQKSGCVHLKERSSGGLTSGFYREELWFSFNDQTIKQTPTYTRCLKTFTTLFFWKHSSWVWGDKKRHFSKCSLKKVLLHIYFRNHFFDIAGSRNICVSYCKYRWISGGSFSSQNVSCKQRTSEGSFSASRTHLDGKIVKVAGEFWDPASLLQVGEKNLSSSGLNLKS